MIYRVIGLMSGSSLDGLDIAFIEFQEQAGKWTYEIKNADCIPYDDEWKLKLSNSIDLSAAEYLLLNADYGHLVGKLVNNFISSYGLQYQVSLISSHGHTTFHVPARKMTAQLGDGAAIAAETLLPVITDLRAMDIAFGGQGAPIVPVGEKWLLPQYDYFLNLGGIANISANKETYTAFDICPANRVLNMLAADAGKEFDEDGALATKGNISEILLKELNSLDYYKLTGPKSLANDFGTDIVYPIIKNSGVSVNDQLRTYTEHIALQIRNAITMLGSPPATSLSLLATGGGAHNQFLVQRITEILKDIRIEVVIPEQQLINFKEALIMAFIGVLRWRQEINVLSTVTGAERDSINGALWIPI
jgi:anhydro-N-acetylmuramic acid kinase